MASLKDLQHAWSLGLLARCAIVRTASDVCMVRQLRRIGGQLFYASSCEGLAREDGKEAAFCACKEGQGTAGVLVQWGRAGRFQKGNG